MDWFFDRLGDLLVSLRDLGRRGGASGSRYYDAGDPDMRRAIEELDEYLESGGFESGRPAAGGAGAYEAGARQHGSAREALRPDYATLEVSFGSPLAEVRKSYKRLLHKYHPDRFSGDAEKQALANEVTQRLNEAFDRIERQIRSG
ncbi:MAG: J domain-containing protein [Spirochaetales bacterium]|nr:J domain-containing protein [Spirochaetales bacterium]